MSAQSQPSSHSPTGTNSDQLNDDNFFRSIVTVVAGTSDDNFLRVLLAQIVQHEAVVAAGVVNRFGPGFLANDVAVMGSGEICEDTKSSLEHFGVFLNAECERRSRVEKTRVLVIAPQSHAPLKDLAQQFNVGELQILILFDDIGAYLGALWCAVDANCVLSSVVIESIAYFESRIGSALMAMPAGSERTAEDSSQMDRSDLALALFREMFYSAANANIVTRFSDGLILDCNEACNKIGGLPREELIGQTIYGAGFVSPERREEIIDEMVRKGWGTTIRDEFTNLEGEHVVIDRTAALVAFDGEQYLLTTMRDATDFERAESLLHQVEALGQIGGFAVNLRTGGVEMTPETYKIYGLPPGMDLNVEVLGEFIAETYTTESAELLTKVQTKLIEDGTEFNVELEAYMRDGRHIWLRKVARPRYVQDEIVGLYGLVQDITDSKVAERERRTYESKLNELAFARLLAERRERERIASNLHDTVIQDLAALKLQVSRKLRQPVQDDTAESLLENMNLIIKRARDLLYEINTPLLHDVGLHAALTWLGDRFDEDGYHVQYHLRGDEKLLNAELRDLFYQSSVELLNNTQKHASASAVIISTEGDANDSQFVLEIADDGIGIDLTKEINLTDQSGFGLFGIRSRMESVGGSMQIDTPAEGGLVVRLKAPIRTMQ